ncbi:MAG: His-Xaa-Ser system radical SAM maturase HxsC [Hyphomonadaceae bacterium]
MKVAPSLHTHAKVEGVTSIRILKVLSAAEARKGDWPLADALVLDAFIDGCAGVIATDSEPRERPAGILISGLRDANVLCGGDVVRLRPGASMVSVLYRRGSKANVLFVTERCNSRCLMCSQPPRDEDDAWRIAELHALIRLVDIDEEHLGVTGGEPTLLGPHLAALLTAARSRLPATHLHVLTNGRLFQDATLARLLVDAGGDQTMWAVPLYGDVASVHDEIVDSVGAFDETMEGLYQLALNRGRVEIRIVLHALSVIRLPQLASFIYRRMPFVEHVTFMGLEPMGYAKSNRARLWIDPADYVDTLHSAIQHLAVRGMNVSIYNLSLCVLPRTLWRFARASISDWKNRSAPECEGCAMSDSCSGFFASAGAEWRSRLIAPIASSVDVTEIQTEVCHELA